MTGNKFLEFKYNACSLKLGLLNCEFFFSILNIFLFFLSFVYLIIFKSLLDLELATKDISKGIGLVLE